LFFALENKKMRIFATNYKTKSMRKNVLRRLMMVLFIAVALPSVKAQVHVGDILYEDNSVGESDGKAIGVVFYVDGTKQHGWAVALNDQGSLSWGPNHVSTLLPDRRSRQAAVAEVNGYGNTEKILSISSQNGSQYPAFDTLDFSNGWYLPALGQLKKLYDNRAKVNASLSAVGGTNFIIEDSEYWSSTEYSLSSAWFMDSDGKLRYKDHSFNGTKDGRRLVRGVRNF
jgi:hypothetical protein